MAENGHWVFDNYSAVRSMYKEQFGHIPQEEIQLRPNEVGALNEGLCVVIFTGQRLQFIAASEIDNGLHDLGAGETGAGDPDGAD